ncbi:MAG: hypothetical protein COA79_13020 [Planctomycetota bacterium]|nr:MAG: hypothetical protein COA79_13020 [Planctomycetota bacterium]
MSCAIFVFSGDPITLGHIDLITKASGMFEKLVIGIANNQEKNYLFSLNERLDMVKECLKNIENIEIKISKGLTVDFALQHKANVIIRGVRTSADLDYELIFAQMNLSQKTNLQTIFIPSDPKYIHVSSSVVKTIQKDHGLITDFVPYYVKAKLEEKLSRQYFVSITGAISAGKSTFSHEFNHYARKKGIEAHNIEMDKLGHIILSENDDPYYRLIRDEIADTFGKDLQNEDSSINREKLGKLVFKDADKLSKLESIIYDPIRIELNRQTRNIQGLVFVTAALIVEKNLLFRSNNNVILVDASKETRMDRLLKAGFSKEDAENRMKTQWTKEDKVSFISNKIKEHSYGTYIEVNTDNGYTEECLESVWNKLCDIFPAFNQDESRGF